MAKIEGNQLRGHLDAMVLSCLERGEGHGFEIVRRLDAAGCGELTLREGTVYPVLYRLERAGLIAGRWEENPGGRRGPRRRVYRLRRNGQRRLEAGREQWRRFVHIVGNIMEPAT
ncbi:MAG: helix-turn-helix transcriptional regulator [Phycisphaerae bacterium]|nr:helix-turn-helix transcriptional regulator [Phycisphaerae bacterium]